MSYPAKFGTLELVLFVWFNLNSVQFPQSLSELMKHLEDWIALERAIERAEESHVI